MYKRIAAATAVILLASSIVVLSAREIPKVIKKENPAKTVILQNGK